MNVMGTKYQKMKSLKVGIFCFCQKLFDFMRILNFFGIDLISKHKITFLKTILLFNSERSCAVQNKVQL